jgi:stage V sporulation protein R
MDKEIVELEKAIERIWEIGSAMGLDPFPTHFEIVPATVMYEIGSYALPGRYSHWTFGKAYHRMKMMYDFGLSRIYEVVINANPSYGFLLETNSPLQNKLVIAHVMGHVDFFKNNAYFSITNRRMIDDAATHARRINEYEFKYGRKVVERFLDSVLSVEEHVDPNFFVKKDAAVRPGGPAPRKSGRYDDLFAPDELPKDPDKAAYARRSEDDPILPEKDLLYFLAKHSPSLEPWQRDIVSMVREEMSYFIPQMQTKTLNEGWACAVGNSLVLSEFGLIRFDELYARGDRIGVAGGDARRVYPITDFHKEECVATIRIRTRRGFTLEGAHKHRVLLADGRWAHLDEVTLGDRVALDVGANVWPSEQREVEFAPFAASASVGGVGSAAGVSAATVARHLRGRATRSAPSIDAVAATLGFRAGMDGKVLSSRRRLHRPERLDVDAAWFLGFFVGDGCVTKSGIQLTTGDEWLRHRVSEVAALRFGLRPSAYWAPTETGGRWRVEVHSRELWRWLEAVGIDLSLHAARKTIPAHILCSPRSVVSAFLRGYFDADAYAGPAGVILSSASDELVRTVQLLLLNFGILSTQRPQNDGCIQLHITSSSAARFREEIDFSLPRKREALRAYVEDCRWFKKEDESDDIVSIEHGQGDVYDITVDTKHAYVANGFVNHNSFWHSRIMRELDLDNSDHLEFAELHSSVVSPHVGQLNPYYLGYRILEDIERRWDHPTEEEVRQGREPGQGRKKIFEVREIENDVSLLRNYLTRDLVEELDLFVYELVNGEEWTITEKGWEKVRDQLVANMTNFGFPYIEVADGDYNRNRELYLKHRFEGVELDLRYAKKTLENCFKLWGRPVHLETVVDGELYVMHCDSAED